MHFSQTKHLVASVVVLAVASIPFVWAGTSSINVGNVPPAFVDLSGIDTDPSDGGSSAQNPTGSGEQVVFTATASDVNGDDYYLAICKSTQIQARDFGPPVCIDGAWAVSQKPVANGTTEVLFYTAGLNNKRVNKWFAYVCDSVLENSKCSKVKQGKGSTGSPFVMPKPVAALKFGAENCPDLADLEDLTDEELADLDRDLGFFEKRALERAGRSEEIEKREKLQGLSKVRPEFCLAPATDDSVTGVIDAEDQDTERKTVHEVDEEELKLNFSEDEDRTITLEFRQDVLEASILDEEGPEIEFKDDEVEVLSLEEPEVDSDVLIEDQEIFQEIKLTHEEVEPAKGIIGGILDAFQDNEEIPVDYTMTVVEPIVEDGITENTVVYESSDSRKVDIYQYRNDPTGVISNELKNFTLYNYGEGLEEELYTIDNSVLHLREDGIIEGYFFEEATLEVNGVSQDLVDRASRVLALDRAQFLHENGNGQPDFLIPVPFALDNENNVVEDFEYEIEGDFFNQLRIRLEVEDETKYPLVLDPTLQFTAPGSSNIGDVITGEGTNDEFGVSLVIADFDDDGISDFAIGAQDQSRVYVFLGDGDIPSAAASADLIIDGENGTDQFGRVLAAGDLNSDGNPDLVVGAAAYSTNTGRLYVFYGNGNGTLGSSSCTTSCDASSDADVTITGEATSDNFTGFAIAIGDMDNDGDEDLVTGAIGNGNGRTYIFYNDGAYPSGAGDAEVEIDGDDGNFGTDFAIGDLDNDGDDDLVATAQFHTSGSLGGRSYIFYNDGAYPASVTSADVRIDGEKANGQFGERVTIGDFDGDGDDDLAIAATRYDVTTTSDEGRVYIFNADGTNDFGTASCTGSTPTVCLASNADETITGESSDDYFGFALASGDVNQDGEDDLIVGASGASTGGRLYVFYNDSFPSDPAESDVIITGDTSAGLGYLALGVGDVNGDGSNDLLGGANNYSTDTGRAYIFYGEGGLERQQSTVTGENGSDNLGGNIVVADLDNDGKDDIAVSAGGYDNGSANDGIVYIIYNNGFHRDADSAEDTILGIASSGDEFGSTLAAGDVDADGDEDLIVAAPASTNGKVYIFYNDGDRSYPDASSADDEIDGVGSGHEFGSALAMGDIDGDGDEDLVVGAKSTTNGTVYVFYNDGSAWPDAGSADDDMDGEGSGDEFGDSLAIGDIDADGDDDLVVGAPSTTNGMVYIFDNDGAAWPDAGSADDDMDGPSSGASFGRVALGDIDADRDIDIVVGAPGTTNGTVYIFDNDGAAYPDAGSADDTIDGEGSGDSFGSKLLIGDVDDDRDKDILIASPDTTNGDVYIFYNDGAAYPDAGSADIQITGEESGSEFGTMAQGDVTGNGIPDLLIGASGYNSFSGRLYIFRGDREWAWNNEYSIPPSLGGTDRLGYKHTISGESTTEGFSRSFAEGDFNGDGILDLAVGAPNYSSSDGRVYIFFNDGRIGDEVSDADVTITAPDISNDTQLGWSIAAGEVSETTDFIDDLVIGAPGASSDDGEVYIFEGRTDWTGIDSDTDADVTIAGVSSGADRFGQVVLVPGDISQTPDAKDDIVIGAPDTANGTVYVYENDGTYPTTAGTADDTMNGAASGDSFGSSLAVGELSTTPDNRPDLVVGSPGCSTNTGCVDILLTDGSAYPDGGNGSADIHFSGEATGDLFGTALHVAELSDTQDIREDLVVGAPGYSTTGRTYVFYNDGAYPVPASADKKIDGEASSDLGVSLASGDYNRDGRVDLAVGSSSYSTNTGRTYVFYNDGSLPTAASSADETITGSSTNDYLGDDLFSLDLDRDGWFDLLVGARSASTGGELYRYDFGVTKIDGAATNTQFGTSFATGDFDHDGDDDLAIGAPEYSSSTGRVYLFFDQDPASFDASDADAIITGASTGDEFGASLAAGRVSESADTADDLVIGAPGNATSYIYIYDGRFEWSATYDATSEYSNRISYAGSNECGAAIAIGDFMGDGREDIAIGCPGADGGDGGIRFNENDGTYPTSSGEDFCSPSSFSSGAFGTTLVAGDVDADGDMDVIGGGPDYSSSTGAVHICYNDGDYGTDVDASITGQASGDEFGKSLAAADVDDDGDIDIAVGAPEYGTSAGRVYLFENDGSYPTGAANAEDIIDASNNDQFGLSMIAADFTSGGRTDLAVGFDDGVSVIFNDGSFPDTRADADLNITGASSSGYGLGLGMGDLNDDGKTDLLIGGPNDTTNTGFAYVYESQTFPVGNAPTFTAGPSEEWDNSTYGSGTETESSADTPTTVGTDVDFKATATDLNGDNYWLIICKTSGDPTTSASGPSCSGSQWAISSSTASGAEATASYTTTSTEKGSNAWYAYVCDVSLCSSVSQGSGDSGSPFYVNLRPKFQGPISSSDTSDASVEPDDRLKFSFYAFDDEGDDTIGVVCDSSGFNESTQQCTSEEICRSYQDRRWNIENTGFTGPFYEVSCISAETCWLAGSGGHIRKTVNGGQSWSTQSSGTGESLLGVSFVDSSNGWAVGTNGEIRYFNGTSWAAQTSGVSAQLNDVHCVDSSNCWVVGQSGTILATTNGGTNWSTQTPDTSAAFQEVHFINSSTGWLVGASGNIQTTTNGGSTWTDQTSGTGVTLRGVHFADANNGWAVGTSGIIRVTTNGGSTWTGQTSNTNAAFEAVECSDSSNCYVVGSDDSTLADSATILRTEDGGSNWYIETNGLTLDVFGLSVVDENTAVAVGQTGRVAYRSSWYSQTSGSSEDLFDISFVDSSNGWAVGDNGEALKTSDGGDSWTTTDPNTSNRLLGVDFVDSSDGWAVGDSGKIQHTSDGGATIWSSQSSGVGVVLRDIDMVDSSNGWVVGGSGTILNTSNGGTAWGSQTSGSSETLFGVFMLDSSNGWVVGANGEILKTTNGGTLWSGLTSGVTENLFGIYFLDSSNGWAAGNAGTILKTTNGGTAWTPQDSGSAGNLREVHFTDSSNGWVMSSSGEILKTTDGGDTWSIQETSTTENYVGAHFESGTDAWAVGTSGTILHTFTGGLGVNYCVENDSASNDLYVGEPEPHGTRSYTLHAYDEHNFPEDGTDESQNITVTDVVPTLQSYSAVDAPNPVAGGSDTVDFTATIVDLNGDNDVTAVEGIFFDGSTVSNSCTADHNDCYIDSTCTINHNSGADSTLTADCSVTVYFNANDGNVWDVHVNPTDGNGKETGFSGGDVNLGMPALSGIDVSSSTLNYGSLAINATSTEQSIVIENKGNQVIDAAIDGENMIDGANTIDRLYQEWSDSMGFTYGTGNDLVETAASTSAATGCFDGSLPVRDVQNDGTGSDDTLYWLLQIPSGTATGSYTSQNTISTITCD